MKKFALIVLVIGLVGFFLFDGYNTKVNACGQVCKDCPTVTWQTSDSYCPSGYHSSTSHPEYCSKGSNPHWPSDYKAKKTFGPITFKYDKSSDPNHCHRPTGSSLNIPSWAQSEFNHDNPEWKNAFTVSCPTPVPTATPTATPTVTPTVTPTATPTVTPTATPFEPQVLCRDSYSCKECQNYKSNESCSRSMAGYCMEQFDCSFEEDGFNCSCPTEEPASTPTATPTATSTPSSGTGGTSDNGGGNPGAPSCGDTKPLTPYLSSVIGLTGSSVKVIWQKVADPVTNYSIYYGPSAGNYLYSVVNTGNTDVFTINGLGIGCFAIRAVNGCATSDLSNEVCLGGGSGIGGGVLGASTLAGTGSFMNSVMNVIFSIGSLLTALGLKKASRKSSK